MAPKTMVDSLIELGGELVSQLIATKFPLTAAWWAQIVGEDDRTLYLASSLVDTNGPAAAYPIVQETLGPLKLALTLGRIKVTGVDDPMTQDVLKLRKRYPNVFPFYIGRMRLGPYEVEEFYAYPFPVQSPAQLHVRLKSDVRQYVSSDYTDQEIFAKQQIVSSGINTVQADFWLQMRRDDEKPLHPIPAGTNATARIVAWENDPNPLLMVTTPDGRRGLTSKNNVEVLDRDNSLKDPATSKETG